MEFDCCRSTFRGSRIAHTLEQQREAHADMLFTPKLMTLVYTTPIRQVHNKPVGHLPLLSSECFRNLRDS